MALLIDILSQPTQARLSDWLLASPTPPDACDPKTFAVAATRIVADGPDVDRWRLVVILAAFEGPIGPQDAADVCIAMGDSPTLAAASEALAAWASPEARSLIEAALAELEASPSPG